jgi:hypothetical protein
MQHVHPAQKDLAEQDEVQHIHPTHQDLLALDRILTEEANAKHVNPGANDTVSAQTNSAGKVCGENLPSHPVITESSVRHPKGVCDQECDLPSSCQPTGRWSGTNLLAKRGEVRRICLPSRGRSPREGGKIS